MKKHLGIIVMLGSLVLAVILIGLGFLFAISNHKSEKTVSREEVLSGFTKLNYDAVGDLEIVQSDTEGISVTGPESYVNNLTFNLSGSSLKITNKDKFNIQLFNLDFLNNNNTRIVVKVKDLNRIDKNGVGTLYMKGFTTDNMTIVNTGTGDSNLHDLVIKDLDILNSGTGNLNIQGLDGNKSLKITKSGVGDANLVGIDNDTLTIVNSGTGSITAQGKTLNMVLNMEGIGDFKGKGLVAQSADVSNKGTGSVTVSVTDDLKVTNEGIGDFNYYGDPKMHVSNNGIGSINAKGAIKE